MINEWRNSLQRLIIEGKVEGHKKENIKISIFFEIFRPELVPDDRDYVFRALFLSRVCCKSVAVFRMFHWREILLLFQLLQVRLLFFYILSNLLSSFLNKCSQHRPWWRSGLSCCVISANWYMARLRSQVWIPTWDYNIDHSEVETLSLFK